MERENDREQIVMAQAREEIKTRQAYAIDGSQIKTKNDPVRKRIERKVREHVGKKEGKNSRLNFKLYRRLFTSFVSVGISG